MRRRGIGHVRCDAAPTTTPTAARIAAAHQIVAFGSENGSASQLAPATGIKNAAATSAPQPIRGSRSVKRSPIAG